MLQTGTFVQHVRTVPGDGVVDHIPLDHAVFHKLQSLFHTGQCAFTDDRAVFDVVQIERRGHLHQVMAPHSNVALCEPCKRMVQIRIPLGLALLVKIRRPVAILQIILKHDDAEKSVNDFAVALVVFAFTAEALGHHGGAKPEGMTMQGEFHLGIGHRFALIILHDHG